MGTITAFLASGSHRAHKFSHRCTHILQVELFLFDVSMSGVFAMVYGVLLIVAGLIIGKKSRPESLAELRTMDRQRLAVFSFAVCVVSSGIFCFVRLTAHHHYHPFSVIFCNISPRFSTKSG